jgi:UDP-N-acetylmuramoyl-tripeptide--D-alanyl-D-alanine ligase
MIRRKSKKILFLEKLLKVMAKAVLKKYHPKIIGITGSVGKTSAKEAIYAVLSGHFRTKRSEKNYNNEIGLPVTIIGGESGGSSIFGWLLVFLRWLWIIILPYKYPEVLILEMGADQLGDIKYLSSFIKCEVAVITDISESHLEYFESIEKLSEEKWLLVDNLKEDGLAVINIDSKQIERNKNEDKNKKIRFLTFGFSDEAEVRAAEVFYNCSEQENVGLSFKLNYKGTAIPVRLNKILARHNIYAALAGIAVGIEFKLNLVEIAKALENFSLPCGRMNFLPGIKNTFIIDDTYNASPVSVKAALEVMGNIKSNRKIAVLGDMLELGNITETKHREIAEKFLEIKGDIFFAVGERMQLAAKELIKRNFNRNNLYIFSSPFESGRKLQEIIKSGDLVLIKGSQGMRMEKVTEEIMAEPEKAEKYLCRQNKEWKKKPWQKV